jgi:hypothetical protein
VGEVIAGRVGTLTLALFVGYTLLSHDGGAPLLGSYRGTEFSIGYPSGWIVDDGPDLAAESIMVAGPFWQSLPSLSVGVHPEGGPPGQLMNHYLKSLASYDDLVLERATVAVHGSGTGYLVQASYGQINTDNERVPIEETTLFTPLRRGRVLEVQYICDPGECGLREPVVRAVMSSVIVRSLFGRRQVILRPPGYLLQRG